MIDISDWTLTARLFPSLRLLFCADHEGTLLHATLSYFDIHPPLLQSARFFSVATRKAKP